MHGRPQRQGRVTPQLSAAIAIDAHLYWKNPLGIFVDGIPAILIFDEKKNDNAAANRCRKTENINDRGQLVLQQVAISNFEIILEHDSAPIKKMIQKSRNSAHGLEPVPYPRMDDAIPRGDGLIDLSKAAEVSFWKNLVANLD
ncbi:MAG: hypothetical protein ACE5I1_10515 [bacterium]